MYECMFYGVQFICRWTLLSVNGWCPFSALGARRPRQSRSQSPLCSGSFFLELSIHWIFIYRSGINSHLLLWRSVHSFAQTITLTHMRARRRKKKRRNGLRGSGASESWTDFFSRRWSLRDRRRKPRGSAPERNTAKRKAKANKI